MAVCPASGTVTGSQYSGNLEWKTGSGKTLSGAFSGAASGGSIRIQTIVRADQKGGSGPNEDYCNLELDRVAGPDMTPRGLARRFSLEIRCVYRCRLCYCVCLYTRDNNAGRQTL